MTDRPFSLPLPASLVFAALLACGGPSSPSGGPGDSSGTALRAGVAALLAFTDQPANTTAGATLTTSSVAITPPSNNP